jgi:general secretion pathway protein E
VNIELQAPELEQPELDLALVQEVRMRALSGQRPWPLLLQDELGLAPPALVEMLARLSGIPAIATAELYAGAVDFGLLGYVECVRRCCALLRTEAGGIRLVLADPFSQETVAWARASLQAPYEVRLAHPDDINAALSAAEQAVRATERTFADDDGLAEAADGDAELLSLEAIAGDSSPVVKLVSSILYDALKQRASDIHLKSSPTGMAVKFRLDGVLVGVSDIVGVEVAQRLISRIKVMSSLDIAERRIPQDGRFRVRTRGGNVDFRVSIMPSIHGEDAVLRLLDRSTLTGNHESMLRLTDLSLDPDALATLRRLVAQPYGMILVTGPTGSGKTTTLYAAIQEINHGHESIITIEDPVEYQLPGVLQIPVNEKKGLTFARGLRSILRHDPDKIMVGEVRDEETAQISVQAALTGHLVLTTVHANNAFDVVGRLLHMGVDAYSLASALVGVWAQRLLRVNCPECARPYQPDAETMAISGLSEDDIAGRDLRAGTGCPHCRGTGYKGRRVVAEYLVMNDALRDLVASRAPVTAMRTEARSAKGPTLRAAALDLFFSGQTTLAEVNRVTFAE